MQGQKVLYYHRYLRLLRMAADIYVLLEQKNGYAF